MHFQKKMIFCNSKGNSIIQVLVASAIMLTIALGLANMMVDQNKQAKAFGEKLLTYELQTQMQALFENSNYCNCAFKNKTFDMTQTPPVIVNAHQFSSLSAGYSSPSPTCTSVGGYFIPPIGENIPGSSLNTESIGLEPLNIVTPGVYKANFSVSFNNSIRAMRPIKTSVQISINMTGGAGPSARPFLSCSTSSSGNSLTVLKPDEIYDGMTGNAACASIGKSCSYVSSMNTIWHDVSCPSALHCMRVCMSWYNQSLPGIPNAAGGSGTDPSPSPNGQSTNVHSCAALVGRYTTYLQVGVVRCGGYFSAVCM